MAKDIRYVAFVRNIMIGRNGLTKEVLTDIFERMGCTDIASYLSTGNIAFTFASKSLKNLNRAIEKEIEKVIARKEEVFIRKLDDLSAIKGQGYYSRCTFTDVYEYCITFFKDKFDGSVEWPFFSSRGDVELFLITDHEAYSVTKRINGKPGTIGAFIEKKLNTRATTRNWNTVERILKDNGR